MLVALIIFLVASTFFILLVLLQFWSSRRKNLFSPFTEDTLRLPAHTIRKKQDDLAIIFISFYWGYLLSIAALILGTIGLDSAMKWTVIVMSVAGSIWNIHRTRKSFLEIRKLGLGREGEEYTGQELNLLMTKGAYVFHDIPYKYGNIDHIVVGLDSVMVVETKTVKKPQSDKGGSSRLAEVRYDGTALHFPHFKTSEPIEQANRHAKYLREAIQQKCGFTYKVRAVVALPGWYVELGRGQCGDTLIINPKRAKALFKWIGVEEDSKRNEVLKYIESVARSVVPSSKLSDPDASKDYDIWLNPRYKEKTLDD